MPKNSSEGSYVIDCVGLEYLSRTQNNAIRAILYEMFKEGTLRVPQAVWDDFATIYEDEAEQLKPYVSERIRLKPAHRAAAGMLASKANSGFRLDPYGNSDWMAAAVADSESCTVVTTPSNLSFYASTLGLAAITLTDLVK